MKVFFTAFALLAVFLAAYPFIFDDGSRHDKVKGLPWQIAVDDRGVTSVFGVSPGNSTLADAMTVLGDDAELAIVEAKGEAGSLEMYYGHYRAGLISGKMILLAGANEDDLIQWKRSAVKVDYMASGLARKYSLDSDNLPVILDSVIQTITFIPAVNLDEEIVIGRFGQPEQKVPVNADLTHYLYPKLGLDIALSQTQKDVLQYVSPPAFGLLSVPLLPEVKP